MSAFIRQLSTSLTLIMLGGFVAIILVPQLVQLSINAGFYPALMLRELGLASIGAATVLLGCKLRWRRGLPAATAVMVAPSAWSVVPGCLMWVTTFFAWILTGRVLKGSKTAWCRFSSLA